MNIEKILTEELKGVIATDFFETPPVEVAFEQIETRITNWINENITPAPLSKPPSRQFELQFIWKHRLQLRAEGDKLRAEGDKLYAEGYKLRAESDKLRAESDKLYAEGDKLRGEGYKLRAEGDKLRTEGDKLRAESGKLYAEGNKLRAEGDKLWAEAILYFIGNIEITWNNSNHCILETGEEFNSTH